MIPSDLLTHLVGAASFGLATIFGIRLRDSLTVPTAASLAPPVALSALELDGSERFVFLAGPLVCLLVLLIVRRSWLEIASHTILFLGIAAVIYSVVAREVVGSTVVLVLCVLLTVVYSVVEVGRQKLSHRGHAEIREDWKMWSLLQGVLLCACGLTVMVVQRMGWPAFVVMAVVLALTKREFDAFGRSRVAYDQTLRALDRLTERVEGDGLISS